MIDYTTGVLLDVAMGPYKGKKTGEHALLRQLMPSIKEGDVMLGDCYYPSFFLMASMVRGADAALNQGNDAYGHIAGEEPKHGSKRNLGTYASLQHHP